MAASLRPNLSIGVQQTLPPHRRSSRSRGVQLTFDELKTSQVDAPYGTAYTLKEISLAATRHRAPFFAPDRRCKGEHIVNRKKRPRLPSSCATTPPAAAASLSVPLRSEWLAGKSAQGMSRNLDQL